MSAAWPRAALAACALSLLPWTLRGAAPEIPQPPFAALVERLSEPGGAFDTDNLISNERGYLEIVPSLVARGVAGGAYVGVGPDQNFSYIARIRPSVAYIIDIRRDNMLLHLLFKALFARARTRMEYLALLTGRAPPTDLDRWTSASLESIAGYLDGAKIVSDLPALRRRLDDAVRAFGVPLAGPDLETIARFQGEFIAEGLGLRFHSFNRPPQPYYPTLRQLLLAADATGRQWSYLASEDDFQFVRLLEGRDAVVPVVGDVAGRHAMRAIGVDIGARGERVSAVYISNVENYLFRDRLFPRYASNLDLLPRGPRSVVIRSIFAGAGQSVSALQPIEDLVTTASQGRYRTYADLVRAVSRP
jgi:hypothetical protein